MMGFRRLVDNCPRHDWDEYLAALGSLRHMKRQFLGMRRKVETVHLLDYIKDEDTRDLE